MPFTKNIKTADRFAGDAGEVKVELFDYSGNDLIYLGVSNNESPDEGADIWWIQKFSYTGVNIVRAEYREKASWTDRAMLGWL